MHNLKWIGLLYFLTISGHSFGQQSPDPSEFLVEVYNRYKEGGAPIPFAEKGKNQIISESFMKIVEEDATLADGEVGALDYDPICWCQDWETMKIYNIDVKSNGHEATGFIDYSLWKDESSRRTQHFKLLLEKERWYIDDIMTDEGSLRRMIEESNEQQKQALKNKLP